MRDVLVVGAGPVGLALATLLTAQGLDVAVWEQRSSPTTTSRAIGIHAAALERLDAAEMQERLLSSAVRVRRGVARTRDGVLGVVPFDRVSQRFPWVTVLPQSQTEGCLAAALASLGAEAPRRGTRLVSLHDDGSRVRAVGATGSGPVEESALFVVGADGARSAVRDLCGIGAPLHTYPHAYVMGDLADSTDADDDAVVHLERAGVVESFPIPGGRRRWVVRTGALVSDPSAEQLCEVVFLRTGVEVDPSTSTMTSAFQVRRRVADTMVRGRSVLVGDAAHEVSPIGGQGMNLGWLDAAHLAPILVDAVRDGAHPQERLDRLDLARRRRAWWSVRQAEANMALGRPVSGPGRVARDLALRATLASPARHTLASVYAMGVMSSDGSR